MTWLWNKPPGRVSSYLKPRVTASAIHIRLEVPISSYLGTQGKTENGERKTENGNALDD